MKTNKINFTVSEDVAELLKNRVDKRKRSTFVSATIREKLQELKQEQLKQCLREGYQTRRDEDARINRICEKSTFEDSGDVKYNGPLKRKAS